MEGHAGLERVRVAAGLRGAEIEPLALLILLLPEVKPHLDPAARDRGEQPRPRELDLFEGILEVGARLLPEALFPKLVVVRTLLRPLLAPLRRPAVTGLLRLLRALDLPEPSAIDSLRCPVPVQLLPLPGVRDEVAVAPA
eukprot:1945591-Rhodomonas_salina.2